MRGRRTRPRRVREKSADEAAPATTGAFSSGSPAKKGSTASSGLYAARPVFGLGATVQKKPEGGSQSTAPSGAALSEIDALKGAGKALPDSSQSFFGSRLGQDFGNVRVHSDARAAGLSERLHARAFTSGNHIAFGPGQYRPGSREGDKLLAHELTHVVQQSGTRSSGAGRIMRAIDKGKYYSDRAGAVSRGRELQQKYTDIEVFQRPDKNWQVRFESPVPAVKTLPDEDAGKYYKDKNGAEARAMTLRAYGYSVEVFARSDGNWQCRLLKLQPKTPKLPASTGPDEGFYFKLKTSADQRAAALEKVGYTVTVFERGDKNWQVEITDLPTFGTPSKAPPPTSTKKAPLKGKTPEPPSKPSKPPAKPDKTPAKTPATPPATKSGTSSGAPAHKLVVINTSDPAKKELSDAVAQSYRDFVTEVKGLTGQDLSLKFGDTVRDLGGSTSKSGADTVSWHKTGRAVDINQSLKWAIREDPKGGEMYFRIYLVHKDKTAKESAPEVVKFAKGTKFHVMPYGKSNMEKWTFVDVTAIAAKHKWTPIPAQSGWKKNYNKQEWWHFEKRDGKTWYGALTDIYTEKDILDGIKSFAKGTAGANKYGARLQREGVPDSVLKKIFSTVTEGGLTLLLPVGESKKAANRTEDVKAVQEQLIKATLLTGTASGVYDADTKKALTEFQKTNMKLKKQDGRVDVAGSTHKKLGAVK